MLRGEPGPLPRDPREGIDFMCGTCTGRGRIYCPDCIVGCPACFEVGEVQCPDCLGGVVPKKRPEWLPELPEETPQPPVSSRGDFGEKPSVQGLGEQRRKASRLVEDPTAQT